MIPKQDENKAVTKKWATDINLHHNIELSGHWPDARLLERFWKEVYETGSECIATGNWSFNETPSLDKLVENGYTITGQVEGSTHRTATFKSEKGSGYLNWAYKELGIWCASDSAESARAMNKKLKELYTPTPPSGEEVTVTFWYAGAEGATSLDRILKTPTWNEIADNYPSEVRAQLDKLMHKDWRPGSAGQLLLWQGRPGTGKTYALRALLKEWQTWCDAFYVTDPERFFGQSSYMLKVLLQEDDDDCEFCDNEAHEVHTQDGKVEDKWRLIILEDGGELLGKDASLDVGQALGRLLNCTDGLIGQGLKVLVLVTTNHELGELNEAVSRPGRAVPVLKFPKFEVEEATSWLGKKSYTKDVKESKTLAELYALLEDRLVKKKATSQVGFGKPRADSGDAPAA